MVFSTTMSAKARAGFGLMAILPLLAPYNFLIKADWPAITNFTWLFFAAISLGAAAVSVLLALVAIFGINRRVEFDEKAGLIHVTESHLIQRKRQTDYQFSEVISLEVICHDWSDGPSTYEISLTPSRGKAFAFGDFSSRSEAESSLASLRAITGSPV